MPDQTPVQIAWVTRDLDATETALGALMGARRWVRMPGVHFGPQNCTYRGRPADFVADISLSYAGDTQLEVIAPVSGESIYTEFLDRCGAGLHHVCMDATNPTDPADPTTFTSVIEDAERDGATVTMAGTMAGGMRFAYLSVPGGGVPYLEIAHIPTEIRAFFQHVKDQVSQEQD